MQYEEGSDAVLDDGDANDDADDDVAHENRVTSCQATMNAASGRMQKQRPFLRNEGVKRGRNGQHLPSPRAR